MLSNKTCEASFLEGKKSKTKLGNKKREKGKLRELEQHIGTGELTKEGKE